LLDVVLPTEEPVIFSSSVVFAYPIARPSIEKIVYSDATKRDALFYKKIELIMGGIEPFFV
jgi:hypothetical protein